MGALIEFDYVRLAFQLLTLSVVFVAITVLIVARLRRYCSIQYCVAPLSLLIHIAVFYIFVILATCGSFNVTTYINEVLGINVISFGTWSSAIRLQTALELLIMVLMSCRRNLWIKSILD